MSRVDQVIEVFPPKCRHCDSRLSRRVSTQGEPRRHQVTELPPIEAHITEYQCQCVVCPECGKTTLAELPQEVHGHFGPQLTALIAYLTVVCRMPRRMVQELLEQVLGIPLSLGSIQNSWEEASEAMAEPCAELEQQLPHEPVVNSDETQELEGLVAKRRDSQYEPGLRSGAWMKMRVNAGQELVIAGYTPSAKNFDALVIGYYDGPNLIYAARTRNGFTPASRAELFKKLKPLEIAECPFFESAGEESRALGCRIDCGQDGGVSLAEAAAGGPVRVC